MPAQGCLPSKYDSTDTTTVQGVVKTQAVTTYPKVVGYVSFIIPFVTFTNSATTTNFSQSIHPILASR